MINAFDHHYPDGVGQAEDGQFVSYCGAPATYDGHDGYDWFMIEGSEVLAAAGGTVAVAGLETPFFCRLLNRQTAGTMVAIDHVAPTGERFRTTYLHLARVLVQVGQTVASGQRIAESGNTGCSLGPHLHFGVYRFGAGAGPPVVIDPYGWQGGGEDPWALHPRGAYSAWLWIDAPEILAH
jgi:murein DD-endopeptidase MepM/ murein hydrolase activator NlpD